MEDQTTVRLALSNIIDQYTAECFIFAKIDFPFHIMVVHGKETRCAKT